MHLIRSSLHPNIWVPSFSLFFLRCPLQNSLNSCPRHQTPHSIPRHPPLPILGSSPASCVPVHTFHIFLTLQQINFISQHWIWQTFYHHHTLASMPTASLLHSMFISARIHGPLEMCVAVVLLCMWRQSDMQDHRTIKQWVLHTVGHKTLSLWCYMHIGFRKCHPKRKELNKHWMPL